MSSEEQAIVPIEEKQVDFYGDKITAVLVQKENEQQVYVPIKPICDYLGLTWPGQSERIRRDPVLSEEMELISITLIKSARGNQQLLCLPLKILPGWLFGVNASRVKAELRQKIILYQRECFEVLWQAFQGEALTTVGQPSVTSPAIQTLIQLREMHLAMARMAEQQIEVEQRLATHETRLNQAAQVVGRLQQRMNAVEQIVQPSAVISQAQAQNITTAVKALAEFMASKEPGKNHYSGIFTELYRRFRVSDYHNIQQKDYRAVLNFLNDWSRAAGAASAAEQTLLSFDDG